MAHPLKTILFLSTAALALSSCAQKTTWPGGAPEPTVAEAEPMMAAPVEAVESYEMADASMAERLNHLERNVAGLQAEMSAARPQIEKINALEGNFRQLSLQLDRIDKTYPTVKASAKAPMKKSTAPLGLKKAAAPKATPPIAAAAKAPATALKVERVRVGEQAGGKVRIVLDTTAPAKLKYDIDNVEKILVIEVPSASWGTALSRTLQGSPLVSSYTAENDAAGSRLIVQLKDAAEVVTSAQVDPDKTGGYRAYLDLRKK